MFQTAYLDGELAIVIALTTRLQEELGKLPNTALDQIRLQFAQTSTTGESGGHCLELERFKNSVSVDSAPTSISLTWAGRYESFNEWQVIVTGAHAPPATFPVATYGEFNTQINNVVAYALRCFNK